MLLVALLGLAVLYIYAVGSFALLHDSFLEDADGPIFCKTLFECFMTLTRYGFINQNLLVHLFIVVVLAS